MAFFEGKIFEKDGIIEIILIAYVIKSLFLEINIQKVLDNRQKKLIKNKKDY